MPAGLLEQHGFRIGLERARDLGELAGAGAPFQLAVVEPVDESLEAKAIEIDGVDDRQSRGGCHRGQPFFTNPTLASSGSSVTRNTVASPVGLDRVRVPARHRDHVADREIFVSSALDR